MIIIHFIEIIHIYGENVQKVYTDFCFLKRRFLNLYMFTLIYILLMKNRFVKHLILLFSLTTTTLSCVDEYTIPKTTAVEYEAEIVIEGRILAGEESVIHLSYTTPLNNEEEAPDILNAQVYIIGQNGYRSEAAEFDLEDDCYVINTRSLENNTLYAVEVTVDSDTYQSKFQPLLTSPEIDEVTWKENESSVSIFVTTQAEKDDSRHFMWSFEEDWEFHAEVDMRGNDEINAFYKKSHYPDLTKTRNPYLYCWMHDVSRHINLHSSSNLSENLVKDVKLHEISIEDIRISYIYSILVKQWSLTDEAYQYFSTMKQYTEESEGLFTPVLSDLQGNITCLSNPDKRAHGYVLASSVTTKRIFIYEEDFEHMRSLYSEPFCISKGTDQEWGLDPMEEWLSPWVIIAKGDDWRYDPNAILYTWSCVDCRHTVGATKKRPDFWPNDHE